MTFAMPSSLVSSAIASAPAAAAPTILQVATPEFALFGLLLLGIALFHRRALAIALTGLAMILAYELTLGGLPTGHGLAALGRQAAHEWVTLTNLFLLLIGFEILASHFERSNMPDHLPSLLPDNWTGGIVLLAMVFVMSMLLDNIAAALVGGIMARHVYKGEINVGFVAAIVGAANAGGAGSVIGDTTTTMMWLQGISPLTVLPAYAAAIPALLCLAIPAAWFQQRRQPIIKHDEPGHPIRWRHTWAVVLTLAAAVAANVLSNAFDDGETLPWLGIAVWTAIAATATFARPDFSVVGPAAKGAVFLATLVAAASLMPLGALPSPSWTSALGLGAVSAVFDNIPLTALALEQGGYDWALLAYAVGFGGSMLWFGSSAGVALTTLYPHGRSAKAWLVEGWFVPLAYVVGFFVMFWLRGWIPSPA